VIVRRRDPEQRHDIRHLAALGRPEREHAGQAVGHLLVQQVTGVLRDEDEGGIAGPSHPGYLGHQLGALGGGGDGPGLVQEDGLGLGAVDTVQQLAGELGDQVEQGDREPLLVGVVVAVGVGIGQGEPGQREDRGPALGVDLLAHRRGEAQPGQPHLGDRPHDRAGVLPGRIVSRLKVVNDLAQARPVRPGHRADRLDHGALAFLAHPGQQQPQRLGGHRPLLGQVEAEGKRVEQAGRGRAERQHPRLAALSLQVLHQRFGVALRVDHRDGRAAQGQLVDEQQRQRGLAAARLTGDGDGGRPVPGRGQQRVEMHDGPGPAERLADVRPDPAGPRVEAVPQFHGGGRHPAGDRVQRLALHVGIQPDPLARQRFAQQRELVTGRVDHVDPDVAEMLDHGLHPADAQVPGRGGHDQPVPAVDKRQAFLGDAVLEHPGRGDLLGQRDRRLRAGLADMRVHIAGVGQTAADVFARLGRRDEFHPRADLDRERQ
jgi:hypothetical protein